MAAQTTLQTDGLVPSQTTDGLVLRMFDKVIASNKIIKSQQRDEPELTKQEKLDILSDLLVKSPGFFLRKFGSVFDMEDLKYFTGSTNYEVQFHVKELQRLLKGNNKLKRTNNRRYKAIEELTTNSDYFTEKEMRERCPLLYEQYIGQFLTEDEKDKLTRCEPGELSLSAHINNKLDNDIATERLIREAHQQVLCEVLSDDSSAEGKMNSKHLTSVLTLSDDSEKAEADKYMLRKEFLRLMHLRFINGDEDFDYSDIDNDDEYDVHDISDRDREESYFDSEEPS